MRMATYGVTQTFHGNAKLRFPPVYPYSLLPVRVFGGVEDGRVPGKGGRTTKRVERTTEQI